MKKKIFDPVHRFIELDNLETELIHSIPFKRLSSIHQIGSAMFVYSGGGHKRSDHSLGTMHIASKIYDSVLEKDNEFFSEFLDQKKDKTYWRRVLRLSALCHDMGHFVFSHLSEDILLEDDSHEEWSIKIINSKYVRPILERGGIDPNDIIKISVGEKFYKTQFTIQEKIFTEMLTGDFFWRR